MSVLGRELPVFGWLLALAVTTWLLLRWTWPGSQLAVAVIALAPFAIVPLIALTVAAYRWWNRALGLVALALWAGYAASILSFGAVIGCGPDPHPEQFSIQTRNVWIGEGSPNEIAASIASTSPDILVLQEVSTPFLAGLAAAPPLIDAYRFRVEQPSNDTASGLAIWSRFPLADARSEAIAGSPMLRARVDGPQGSFSVVAVHVTAPLSDENVTRWDAQLRGLATLESESPTLLVGDFNATEDHRQFRELLTAGWTDVHASKGCGIDATWPDGGLTPTFARIDHILTSSHFETRSVDVGSAATSDHRPVTANLVLRTTAAGPAE